MRLVVNRLHSNGGVNAIAEYNVTDWCILVFPSIQAAEFFASVNNMELSYTDDVRAQMEMADKQNGR